MSWDNPAKESEFPMGRAPASQSAVERVEAAVLSTAAIGEFVFASVALDLARELDDAKGDALRLHKEKMDYFDQIIEAKSILGAQPGEGLVECARREAQGWIPVSERLPDVDEIVVTVAKARDGAVVRIVGHRQRAGWILACTEDVIVTHWMPLPAAPQPAKGGR